MERRSPASEVLSPTVNHFQKMKVADNVNVDELGNLGLSPDEEAAVVAFMKTLTDDYPVWGRDPAVLRGTPSPFSANAFPPFP